MSLLCLLWLQTLSTTCNPTHGSGWFFQMLSTPKLTQWPWNPTNGSWWIVQISSKKGFEVSTHCREWDYKYKFRIGQ